MEGEDLPAAQGPAGTHVTPQPAIAPRHRSFVGGWAIAAVLAVVAVLLYQIRIALLPFVFAVAVAFVLDPLIRAGSSVSGPRAGRSRQSSTSCFSPYSA